MSLVCGISLIARTLTVNSFTRTVWPENVNSDGLSDYPCAIFFSPVCFLCYVIKIPHLCLVLNLRLLKTCLFLAGRERAAIYLELNSLPL